MEIMNLILGKPLGWLMRGCYELTGNYALTIVFFALIAKLVMLPVAILMQKNSIKMVKLQPEIRQLKRLYAGDKARINDETFKLYEREGYNPAIGIIPTALQVLIILGLLQVVYHPLQHLFGLGSEIITELIEKVGSIANMAMADNYNEIHVIEAIRDPAYTETIRNLGLVAEETFAKIRGMNMDLWGIDLSKVPAFSGNSRLMIIPILSGLSSLALCLLQNHVNVLQKEEGKFQQIAVTVITVGISLYLAFFVPSAVGFYWILGNLLAMVQVLILNKIMDPRKYINYENRENGQLMAMESDEAVAARLEKERESEARSSKDMNRFRNTPHKLLVVYSEKSGFYSYYAEVLDYLLKNYNIRIHYLTGDPEDAIFQNENPQIEKYYICDKHLAKVFAGMDADIVLMTMPDLNTYHVKRSVVKKDVEYLYIFHAMMSTNMAYRKAAFDHFDTILCVGPYQVREIRETEKLYKLKPKKLIEAGYGALDNMMKKRAEIIAEGHPNETPMILIAPSHHPGNIMESCLDEILANLDRGAYKVVVRPHPQWVRRNPDKVREYLENYREQISEKLVFEVKFTSQTSILSADMLITDWSGTAFEYCFTTNRPALFVNTPMKVINPEYDRYENKPIEITFRTIAGQTIDLNEMDALQKKIDSLFEHADDYREAIERFLNENFFNIGHSGEVSGEYIVNALQSKKNRSKK